MSQEQAQVSKSRAARAAASRRRHSGAGGEPESAYWQPPWYRPAAARDASENDDKTGD